ncbi:ABC transporter substrate-binding protein [Amycolatopsis rhizosphaerae]|uniref:ABC transporter substrate-binding protein n=1 Tax=Amycolatopsis rhizosphaerae TaxID=2053003 RepID=A0A558DKB4_9PSEU|nr:ABC transporter substrate-binding protein [Amycolatopsis rhizosphaerae]TVT61456.1 ABC transporter substrate-binding protein [Amycolatopsis rhizosphaerae]
MTTPATGDLHLPAPLMPGDLDPARSRPAADVVNRMTTRTLFGYRAEPDQRDWRAVEPVGDLAMAVPSTYNAGLGASLRSYVVHLRPGVRWDTEPPRGVTAHDVVRGFARACSPTARPAGIEFLLSGVRGMRGYADRYAGAVAGHERDVARHRAFRATNAIPGVFALDDESLVIEFERPALDAVDILALPCLAPAPVEYDAIVPGDDDFVRYARSTGPYRIAGLDPDGGVLLEPNPVWDPAIDPLRERAFGGVTLRPGAPAPDVAPDTEVPEVLHACLLPNAGPGRPLADPALLRLVASAVAPELVAAAAEAHLPGVRAATRVVPPGNSGNPGDGPDRERLDPDPPSGPADGTTLVLVRPDTTFASVVADAVAGCLERAGIRVTVRAIGAAAHAELLYGDSDGDGEHDLLLTGWAARWRHHNYRAYLQPLLTRRTGRVDGTVFDVLIDEALDADSDPRAAKAAWARVEEAAMTRAAVIPLLHGPPLAARRVPGMGQVTPMYSLGMAADPVALRPEGSPAADRLPV